MIDRQGNEENRDSDSPILFFGISKEYTKAFETIWQFEFAGKHEFYWDKSQVLHPISHLLGVALETSIKGLISCRGQNVPRSHDLQSLIEQVSDNSTENQFREALSTQIVPEIIFELNDDKKRSEIAAYYRRQHFHVESLNRVYNRPFATRYPVLGGHALPNPDAINRITKVLQAMLETEMKNWRPKSCIGKQAQIQR